MTTSKQMSFWVVPGIERKESEYVTMAVCDIFETDIATLKANKKSRKENLVAARHFIYYLLRELRNEDGDRLMTYAECGKVFIQDHATALSAYKKMKFLVKKDSRVKEQYITIQNKITQLKSFPNA